MTWATKRKQWDWRSYLTAEEKSIVDRADAEASKIAKAREAWTKKYGRQRSLIVNRAVQRAKFEFSAR